MEFSKQEYLSGVPLPSPNVHTYIHIYMDSVVKNPPTNAGDMGSILGLRRSPGEEKGNPLSTLAWEIPWTEKPGGLYSLWGRKRVRQD